MLVEIGPESGFAMWKLWGPGGVSRRAALQAGALGLGYCSLADVLRADATAPPNKRPKSVIYVVLSGGPSHIDMWDLKPHAPYEYRGPFRPISTALPGEQICEFFPRQAERMDRIALIRGMASVENDHYLAEVYSGLPRSAGKRPAFGCVASRLAPSEAGIPPYVSLNEAQTEPFEYEKPHYIGAGHSPFRPFGDALEDMSAVGDVARLDDRKHLLRALDRFHRRADETAAWSGLNEFQLQALEIMTSPRTKAAFDLSQESPETIAKYGKGRYTHQTVKDLMYDWPAKSFVLARRLVEAGVRVVTLRPGDWDHHGGPTSDIFLSLSFMLPALDQSIAGLMDDLKERGLDEDVLVVVVGEFGRTPRITTNGPGREHWAEAGCALLMGGGLKMGQVIGATDPRAERAERDGVNFQNFMATIYHTLGVDPSIKLSDFNGRPQYILEQREPIRALLS